MQLETSSLKKVRWLGAMIGLFMVSFFVVSQNNSTPESEPLNSLESPLIELTPERIERERKIELAIETMDQNLERLKTKVRESHVFTHQRKELRKLQRSLMADRRIIRQELRELRKASNTDWEHLADHLEADLQRSMQAFHDGVVD